MRDNFGVAPDMGWFNRKIAELQRQIESLRSERRAAATTVSEGDFTVSGGGSIRVLDGGDVLVGSDGVIRSDWPNGDPALLFGPIDGDGRQFGLYAEDGSGAIFSTIRYQPGGAMPGGYSALTVGTATQDVLIDIKASTATVEAATQFRVDSPAINLNTPATTGASANAVLFGTFNQLQKSTSSRRYKQDIEDVEIDAAVVLQLVGKSWRDRAQVAADPDIEQRYVGFIAEDLDELGLTEFVIYDDEGRPDAISYDRLTVALLAVAKYQQTRLDDIEARLDRLET